MDFYPAKLSVKMLNNTKIHNIMNHNIVFHRNVLVFL